MKNIIFTILLFSISLTLFCITNEGERPAPLLPPTFDSYGVNFKDSSSDSLVESVSLHWSNNRDNKISTISYTLLRYLDTTSNHQIIKNIPSTIRSFYDQIAPLIDDSLRETTQFIRYKIIPIDSLYRPGDTSVACTVNVAPSVQITSPGFYVADSSNLTKFTWTIHPIQNEIATSVTLLKSDSAIWQSQTNNYFTGGNSKSVEATLPDSILPLSTGLYYWYVSLRIITGNNEPESFTYRITNVGN